MSYSPRNVRFAVGATTYRIVIAVTHGQPGDDGADRGLVRIRADVAQRLLRRDRDDARQVGSETGASVVGPQPTTVATSTVSAVRACIDGSV